MLLGENCFKDIAVSHLYFCIFEIQKCINIHFIVIFMLKTFITKKRIQKNGIRFFCCLYSKILKILI